MFCTCSRSSMQTPPGKQSSRRLQLVQVTSNLRSGWLMNRALDLNSSATTADMASPFASLSAARRNDVAHTLEFSGLIEERPRAKALGDLPVRVGGVVRQHHHVELRRLGVQLAQHV